MHKTAFCYWEEQKLLTFSCSMLYQFVKMVLEQTQWRALILKLHSYKKNNKKTPLILESR